MSTVKTVLYNLPKPDGVIKLVHKKDVKVTVANMRSIIKVKTTGDLKAKAFYLPKAYKWIMANDAKGNLCLIPRAK